jgi:hypothetical protein
MLVAIAVIEIFYILPVIVPDVLPDLTTGLFFTVFTIALSFCERPDVNDWHLVLNTHSKISQHGQPP